MRQNCGMTLSALSRRDSCRIYVVQSIRAIGPLTRDLWSQRARAML
jgi:hypothetical protein